MTQKDLFIFDDLPFQNVERIELHDGELLWVRHFLPPQESSVLFSALLNTLPWQQDHLSIAGKSIPVPRLQAWIGDPGTTYHYSGLTLEPQPWTEALLTLRHRIEDYTDTHFNSLLANLYRNEHDSVSWHADNEPELGRNPVVASLSLGESRDLQLKHNHHKDQKISITLKNGDLLIMKGPLQHHWLHQIPKQKEPCLPRINLTFRTIF